jgi:hypothetical protein
MGYSSDINSYFPHENKNFTSASIIQLIKSGAQLHFATLWGPLRASQQFRINNSHWLSIVIKRWLNEYGLNVVLFVLAQIFVLIFFIDNVIVGEVVAFVLLPFLTIVQMFIDRFRNDSNVFYDTENSTSMSVKRYQENDNVIAWAFFNHYALPIGYRKGARIRQHIHTEAKTRKVTLMCHAQNNTIAEYYLNEYPHGINMGGPRPLLIWNYANKSTDDIIKSGIDIFGINSIRNTGQLPATAYFTEK